MEDKPRKYPANGLVLEVLCTSFFGLAGLGHMYSGSFFSGAVILLSYWLLLVTEVIFLFLFFTSNFGIFASALSIALLLRLTPLFFLHNVLFALISASMIRLDLSKKFAKLLISGIFFLASLVSFAFFIKNNKLQDAILAVVILIIVYTLMKKLIDFEDGADDLTPTKDLGIKEYVEKTSMKKNKFFEDTKNIITILILISVIYLSFTLIKKTDQETNRLFIWLILAIISLSGFFLVHTLMNLITKKE